MQQDAPIESGIGAFAKSFGNTVAKGSRNEQQQAFKAWLETKKEGAGLTKQSSEDKAKMDRLKTGEQFKINHTNASGKGDPQLVNARKALEAVNKIETHLKTFGDSISNPMNTSNNPMVTKHYELYLKDAIHKGKNTDDAINYAKQKVFAASYPDEAKVLYNAHAGGTVAHILQNYPQLGQEFPTVALKYQPAQQPKAPISPDQGTQAPAIQTQRQPQQNSQAPMIQPKAPAMPPTQTAQAPMAQPKAPVQPPMQMAQVPPQQMKMPSVGNNPVGAGPIAPPNTMIPGQGPAAGQDEEELDNTPSTG